MTYPETLIPTPLAPLYGEGVVEWMDVFGFAIPVTWGDPGAEYDGTGHRRPDGAEITVKGKPAGTISMAIPSPALDGKMLRLARIDKACAMVGTTVSSHGSSGTVVAMSAYDPKRKRARG